MEARGAKAGGGGGNLSGMWIGWCGMVKGGGQAHSTVMIDKENTPRWLRRLEGEYGQLLALCMGV